MARSSANLMAMLILVVLVLGALSLGKGLTKSSPPQPQTVAQSASSNQTTGDQVSSTSQQTTTGSSQQSIEASTSSTSAATTSGSSSGETTSTQPVGVRSQSGANQTVSIPLSLSAGQGMIGQAFGFQDKTGGCQVFAVIGPYTGSVTVTDGEWWMYQNGDLTAQWVNHFLSELEQKQSQLYSCGSSTVSTIP